MIAESTGVVPEGRISPACAGLYTDEQEDAWAKVVDFAHSQGAAMGIQVNHAGRKASTVPARSDVHSDSQPLSAEQGGWRRSSPPSPIAGDNLVTPREFSREEIHALPGHFAESAACAARADFGTIEIHGAHGYLLHQFLSP